MIKNRCNISITRCSLYYKRSRLPNRYSSCYYQSNIPLFSKFDFIFPSYGPYSSIGYPSSDYFTNPQFGQKCFNTSFSFDYAKNPFSIKNIFLQIGAVRGSIEYQVGVGLNAEMIGWCTKFLERIFFYFHFIYLWVSNDAVTTTSSS